ncbi:MAG: DUF5131 family protein [Clostridia bacterium]|nr:DUF5131 family protein [Clostridia bacterium]
MGDKTKIDWADSTWNPITGCLHGCEYCYARKIAERFGGYQMPIFVDYPILREPYIINGRKNPYPFDFTPTFHRYKLDEPKRWAKPRTIFVCSMADLFGAWVPDEWIQAVFDACDAAPQHRYLFLTKNPNRYIDLAKKGMLPRQHWYGYSATRENQLWRFHHADDCPCINLFVSIEPILEPMAPCFSTHTPADWVIIGAETGQRKGKVIPKKEWIENILVPCLYSGIPIFMKESLRPIMGEDFR